MSFFVLYAFLLIKNFHLSKSKVSYFFDSRGICKGKGKGISSSLDIAPLTILDSSALQSRKWQLTGIDCSTAAQASSCPSQVEVNGFTVLPLRNSPVANKLVFASGSRL